MLSGEISDLVVVVVVVAVVVVTIIGIVDRKDRLIDDGETSKIKKEKKIPFRRDTNTNLCYYV